MSIVEKFMTMEYGPAPEDAKEALAWLDKHQRKLTHFIANKWTAPSEGKTFETTDPATGDKLATIAQGSAADIDAAVKAARAALPGRRPRQVREAGGQRRPGRRDRRALNRRGSPRPSKRE